MAEKLVRVQTAELPLGKHIKNPIFQHSGQNVLLPAGGKITRDFLMNLEKRDIKVVRVHSSDCEAWRTEPNTPEPRWFDFSRLSWTPVSDSLKKFVRRLNQVPPAEGYVEKRKQPRFTLMIPVSVMPMDESYRPLGHAFEAMSRNISADGFCFMGTRAVTEGLLLIELMGEHEQRIQVLMQVIRCNQIGRYYEIAGPLIYRLES